ncbi:MAG: ATP-binding protein [Bacteroidota bacterium]
MQFAQVIGQESLKEKLRGLYQQNRISHALMLVDREGTGGLPLALAFAQYLVCEKVNNKQDANETSLFGPTTQTLQTFQTDSCGVCPACKKAASFVHPDIHYSFPTVSSKSIEKPKCSDFITEYRVFLQEQPYGNLFDWIERIKEKENSQGKITTYECEDINKKLSRKNFESPFKILILWMPEMLEKEGNKLLKIIEEPPSDTLFILVTENENQVLPTIHSRCQVIRLPMLSSGEIETALLDRQEATPTSAKQVAQIADGNYREALQQIQHAEEGWQQRLRDWLNAILKTGPAAQVKWVEEISKTGREKQKQFLRYVIHVLETSMRIQATGQVPPVGEEETALAIKLNRLVGIEQLEALTREMDKSIYYVERNANAKMLFHALTLKVYHVIQDKVVLLMSSESES